MVLPLAIVRRLIKAPDIYRHTSCRRLFNSALPGERATFNYHPTRAAALRHGSEEQNFLGEKRPRVRVVGRIGQASEE